MNFYCPIISFILCFNCFIFRSIHAQSKDTTLTIYYETNSFSIDSFQYHNLSSFLTSVKAIKQITGYTDSTGKKEYNFKLSQKRADHAALIIKKMHVDVLGNLLYQGEDHVQDPNLAKNRKVEITGTLKSAEIPTIKERGEVVRSIDLENIYFLPDRAIITEESLPYVTELARLLKAYKTENFEIIGHVNYQSRKDSSQLQDLYWLSERRAKAIYTLLIEKGIPATRMFYKGVGNSQPLYPNPVNEEEKRRNMRVQVVILGR